MKVVVSVEVVKKHKKKAVSKKRVCFRCGRDSHWVVDCFAKTHDDGSRLHDESSDSD